MDDSILQNVRGIRGAIDVLANDEQKIVAATKNLLQKMVDRNNVNPREIGAIIFTATSDLNAAFPARAARELGWQAVPLMCAGEIDVPGSLPRCIRVLMLVNTAKTQQQIKHIYCGGAKALREDLLSKEEKE